MVRETLQSFPEGQFINRTFVANPEKVREGKSPDMSIQINQIFAAAMIKIRRNKIGETGSGVKGIGMKIHVVAGRSTVRPQGIADKNQLRRVADLAVIGLVFIGSAAGISGGCAFVDVSTGGLHSSQKINVSYGYQLPFARAVRLQTGVPTIACGLIKDARQAESVLVEGTADLVDVGRQMLLNPHWGWQAALELGEKVDFPPSYVRGMHR